MGLSWSKWFDCEKSILSANFLQEGNVAEAKKG
jgi:hypothetical protein